MNRSRVVFAILALGIAAVPMRAYVTARRLSDTGAIVQQRWGPGAFPIRWRMNPSVGTNVTGTASDQERVFQASFGAWQAVTSASVTFAQGDPTASNIKAGYDGVNVITTNVTRTDYGADSLGMTIVFSFDRGGVVDELDRPVDFAGQILEADVMFNPSIGFSTGAVTPPDRIDLQSVATHEIGHLLGLDHTNVLSATMYPFLTSGSSYARNLSVDDISGVSTVYPNASFTTKGTLTGTVRTTSNATVFGAMVTAVNSDGQPVASAITDPDGRYTIAGLDAGSYTVYAEPLDQPVMPRDLPTLGRIYPGLPVFTNFTTRFR